LEKRSAAAQASRFAGEFVVIVIGVFVALAADRWQQTASERESERSYLERLRTEIAADTARMKQLVARSEQKRVALAYIEAAIARRPPADSLRDLAANMREASYYMEQDFRTTAFDELQSTGRLMLLSDAEVRAAVVAYHEFIERYLPRIDRRRGEYPELLARYIPPSARVSVTSQEHDPAKEPTWAFALLADPRLPHELNVEYRFAEYAGERFQLFYERGAQTLALLDGALARR